MRASSDFDPNTYPNRVDFTGGVAYFVTDVRTQEKVFDAGAGNPPDRAIAYAKEHNAAYWTKVARGELQTS